MAPSSFSVCTSLSCGAWVLPVTCDESFLSQKTTQAKTNKIPQRERESEGKRKKVLSVRVQIMSPPPTEIRALSLSLSLSLPLMPRGSDSVNKGQKESKETKRKKRKWKSKRGRTDQAEDLSITLLACVSRSHLPIHLSLCDSQTVKWPLVGRENGDSHSWEKVGLKCTTCSLTHLQVVKGKSSH